MVLKVFTNNDVVPFEVDDTFCITKSFNGLMSLQFDVSPDNSKYKLFQEETVIEYDCQYYLVKGINERKTMSTINCELDLDGLQINVYQQFNRKTESFYNISKEILANTGWSIVNAELVSVRRSLELTDVSTLDILDNCTNSTVFDITYKFDTINKTITIIKPLNNTTPSGTYFTDELNLSDMTFKGSSSAFATRLYAYGKDGLTISSVNGGKEYIDNNTYSDKIVSLIWRDERYTDAQSLFDDAVIKLAALAVPERSYTAKVIDLAKAMPAVYGSLLKYELYDVVTLIDRNRKTRINHRIVETKDYPTNPSLNTVTLSSIAGTVSGKLTTLDNRLTELNAQQLHDRTKVNEIKQDLDTTVLHVAESWASSVNESLFTQTSEGLFFQVDKIVGTNRWSTLVQQSATDVRIAWNNISKYIQFENAELNIYDTTDTKLMSLSNYGQDFYYKGTSVGKIGTNNYKNNDDIRGLSFDLENSAGYMAWAWRKSETDDIYTIKFAYTAKKVDFYEADQLHAGCDFNMHGFNLHNAVLKDWKFSGGSISGTWSGNVVTSFRTDGTAATWRSFKLTFKNGILQSAEW